MEVKHNPNQISELIRTQSLWLTKNDSLEDIVISKTQEMSINSNNIDDVNLDNNIQSQNEFVENNESTITKIYKSINIPNLKGVDSFKKFLTTKLSNLSDNESIKDINKLNNENISDDFISDTSSSISEIDENELLMEESDNESIKPSKLKDLMIYKTIRFMDYRRFSRRFNGIRKPVSNKKALLICIFCAILAMVPFIGFESALNYYILSIRFKKEPESYISSFFYILSTYFLAKIQLILPLHFPVFLSYFFMFTTLIIFIVIKNFTNLNNFVWKLLISYALIQLFVTFLTVAFIYFVPILALHGKFFPCTEHYHLIKRSQQNRNLSITISRYNDYTSIWEGGSCGLFVFIYRCFVRLSRAIKSRIYRGNTGGRRTSPLFGHQLRYRGKLDSNNLPHGYGEWLEDHIYGERLQGYWWHGYPVGPFSSQEIGSGSIFVNNRVAFITGTHLVKEKLRYGVSSTECSISGHFFKQMPKTYFFNPEYRKWSEGKEKGTQDIFHLLRNSFDQIPGSSPEWCVDMLKRQFHLNKPNNLGQMNIYVDKSTNTLKIDGYRLKEGGMDSMDEITVKLIQYKKKRSRPSQTNKNDRKTLELPLYKSLSNRLFGGWRNETESEVKKALYRSRVSMLIRDEDDWENKQHTYKHKIIANGWTRVRPSMRSGLIPEHVVLYIHGYNVTLNMACSQMAHIVSFAKLPPYVIPFVFNWDGHHWGIFSAFAYPKSIKMVKNKNIEKSFIELLKDLLGMGVKSIHFLVHSCGARVFFNVIIPAIKEGFIVPVLSNEFLVINTQPKLERLRLESIILINPDYPMERFRNEDYFIVRGYCDHIVMYVNSSDQCLWVSEFYNRERSLGKCIFDMCTSPQILAKVLKKEVHDEPFTIYDADPSKSGERELVGSLEKVISVGGSSIDKDEEDNTASEESPRDTNLDKEEENTASGISHTVEIEKDEENTASGDTPTTIVIQEDIEHVNNKKRASLARLFQPRYSVNKYKKTKNVFWTARTSSDLCSFEDRSLWLDMDVIDTSMIDTNVDFLKHSFYQVKREIMDDIREVILMNTRAEQRQTRLDRRRGNVYVFRVAPRDVSKIL